MIHPAYCWAGPEMYIMRGEEEEEEEEEAAAPGPRTKVGRDDVGVRRGSVVCAHHVTLM